MHYILGVARYTDVTVRYDFSTTGKKKQIYYARLLFIYFEQSSTVVMLNIILHYIYNLQYIYTALQ